MLFKQFWSTFLLLWALTGYIFYYLAIHIKHILYAFFVIKEANIFLPKFFLSILTLLRNIQKFEFRLKSY